VVSPTFGLKFVQQNGHRWLLLTFESVILGLATTFVHRSEALCWCGFDYYDSAGNPANSIRQGGIQMVEQRTIAGFQCVVTF
jgi:hypothetical protein